LRFFYRKAKQRFRDRSETMDETTPSMVALEVPQQGLMVKGHCTSEFADFCIKNKVDFNAASLSRTEMTRIVVAYIKDNHLRTGRNIMEDSALTTLNGGEPLLRFDDIPKMLQKHFIQEAQVNPEQDDKESSKSRTERKRRFWNSSEVQTFLKQQIASSYPREFLPAWLTDPGAFYRCMSGELFEALWKELESGRPYRPDCFMCIEFDFPLMGCYLIKARHGLADKFGSEFEISDDLYDSYIECDGPR
jgi:hypothetical protein